MQGYTLVRQLEVPYETVRTIYDGNSEVRLYENEISGEPRVGKRVDLLGMDESVALNEVETLTSIKHENIVSVYDVLRVPGFPSPMKVVEIVMPYFPMGSVYDYLDAGREFSLLEACENAQAALTGLAHLHDVHGILHRDVKGPNLLLSGDRVRLKVSDLGTAARMDRDGTAPAHAQAGHLYVPPETHRTGRIGRSGDVYGMGLALFEMANGPFPYKTYTVSGIAERVEAGRPGPRPRDLRFRPYVPRGLRRVIGKAIQRNPVARYQRVQEMSSALARVRLIDWRRAVADEEIVWEGQSVQRRDRAFRVEAVRAKRGSG